MTTVTIQLKGVYVKHSNQGHAIVSVTPYIFSIEEEHWVARILNFSSPVPRKLKPMWNLRSRTLLQIFITYHVLLMQFVSQK